MGKKRGNSATGKQFAKARERAGAGTSRKKKTQPKIRLLYHGDSPKVNTGFGVVARELLSRLQATGKYDIHSVGINDKGDPNRFPELADIHHYPLPHYNEDPYGAYKLPQVIKGIRPDVIFTLNDIWVLEGSENNGTKGWFINALRKNAPYTPWVFYFPVDSRPWTLEWANLAFTADKTVVYSKYASEVLGEIHEHFKPEFIPHGVSIDRFNVLSNEDRKEVRKSMGVSDDEFVMGFVSRNQPRKNPAAIVEIFKMANEGYRKCTTCEAIRNLDDPKCELCGESNDVSIEYPAVLEGKAKCYLHFNFEDNMGLNMNKVINDNKAGNGIIYNPQHSIPFGLPDAEFNAIFNALDCHLLTTTSEGFGLTVVEGMAAGVPTMATRSTAVTELLEQGGGIPIIPRMHHVFKDAANSRKHLIDPERAVLALGELYQDWLKRGDNRWGPETAKRVQKGLEFAKSFTWDNAAKMFDETFQAAIDGRIKIVDQFSEKEDVAKIMFQKAGNAGDILSTLPAIKRFKEQHGDKVELAYAIPKNLMPIFENKIPWVGSIIPMDRLNDKNPEKKKVQVSITNFNGPEERYEAGAYPFLDRSRPEIYCLHANVSPADVSVKGIWGLTEEEVSRGRELFESQVGEKGDNFVVGLSPLTSSRMKQWGEGMDNWNDLKKYIEKAKMKVFMLDETKKLVDNLAAFKMCDLVVTPDGDVLDFLNALDIPTVALISPFWRVRVKNCDNVKIIARDDLASAGVRENLGAPHMPSKLIDDIGVGQVFSPILTYNKMWQRAKKEAVNAATEKEVPPQEEPATTGAE